MTHNLAISGGKDVNIRYPERPVRFIVLMALVLIARSGAAQAPVFATLYSFKGAPDGAEPHAAVVIGKNGALYGTTYMGGANQCATSLGVYQCGTIFELIPSASIPWKEIVLHNFNGTDGEFPNANLVFGSGGILYGTTTLGGTAGGAGTVFDLTPPSTAGGGWTETVLYSFPYELSGQTGVPQGAVLIGPSGTLYTTAQGGCCTAGTVVALTPPATAGGTWTEFTIYYFGGSQGSYPLAGLVSEGGALFGTDHFNGDFSCGVYGCGAVYQLTPTTGGSWTETTIHTFGSVSGDGGGPQAALTIAPGGALYGTTFFGGSGTPCLFPGGGCGTVFQLIPPAAPGGAWTESVLYRFEGLNGDGAYPSATLVLGLNGVLYGTTQYGGSATSGSPCTYYGVSGCGTVFELTPPAVPGGAWTEKVLHSFTGQHGDGAIPIAGLALGPSGVLYGTTSRGGVAGLGTVFAIKP